MQTIQIQLPSSKETFLPGTYDFNISDANYAAMLNNASGMCKGELCVSVPEYPYLKKNTKLTVLWSKDRKYPVAMYDDIRAKLVRLRQGEVIHAKLTSIFPDYLVVAYHKLRIKCPYRGYINELKSVLGNGWMDAVKNKTVRVMLANCRGENMTGLIIGIKSLDELSYLSDAIVRL